MLRRGGRILMAWIVLTAVIPAIHAQTKRHLTLVDLLNVPNLTDPQLSPDGRQVLYTLARADWKANKRVGHIWRVQADGTAVVQVTTGPDGESSPRWSPDGTSIAFVAKRAGSEEAQLYLISNTGGEARVLTHHATSVSRPTWSPDGLKSISSRPIRSPQS